MNRPPSIQTKPEFEDLGEHDIHAALQSGETSAISLEVARLIVAYVDAPEDPHGGKSIFHRGRPFEGRAPL